MEISYNITNNTHLYLIVAIDEHFVEFLVVSTTSTIVPGYFVLEYVLEFIGDAKYCTTRALQLKCCTGYSAITTRRSKVPRPEIIPPYAFLAREEKNQALYAKT